MKFIDIEFVIFGLEMDLLWIIENQISENFRNEHFREIFKLTSQMIFKSWNLYININPRTWGF